MANTPNLGLPYPVLSDTADVPRDIKALADKLDALLGGGGGGGGGGTLPLSAAPVGQVGQPGQVRAGHQLAASDFTGMGLAVPAGLFNLGSLTNLGSGGPLVNLGAVPFGIGINGQATTAAVFAGSTGQALYIDDTGAADPFRIRTGSVGCWCRTAKRGTDQMLLSKYTSASRGYYIGVVAANTITAAISTTGSTESFLLGVSDVADDRWHHIVATFDGTALRCYVDGVLEAVTAVAGSIFASVAPLNVGAFGANGSTAASQPNYGRVDEAFVTADVLTEDQVRALYCARLGHSLGLQPTAARLNVRRRRRGAALAVADFPTQPVRLHNFTGGALTDQGSGGVPLVANPGTGTITDVAGADGTVGNSKSFSGSHQGLSATDAGLPGGLTPRSYGAWFKRSDTSNAGWMGWGTMNTGDARLWGGASIASSSGADTISGPFVADGQWHHVVVVEDNTAGDGVRRKLYLDGRLVGGSTVLNAVTLAGANRFRIGASPDGTAPYIGQVDGAFVHNVALTAEQVWALYDKATQQLQASPKEPGQHIEAMDAVSVTATFDTLESVHLLDLGVVA